jgi:hypothetical protein
MIHHRHPKAQHTTATTHTIPVPAANTTSGPQHTSALPSAYPTTAHHLHHEHTCAHTTTTASPAAPDMCLPPRWGMCLHMLSGEQGSNTLFPTTTTYSA